MSIKSYKEQEWGWWKIDADKCIKAYDDNLNCTGWLYYGSHRGLIHLEAEDIS